MIHQEFRCSTTVISNVLNHRPIGRDRCALSLRADVSRRGEQNGDALQVLLPVIFRDRIPDLPL